MMFRKNINRGSFTLIELLVVLALVAILSVVVILTLNPAELLKQARDSNRLSDLSTINTALNLFSTDVIGGFMGTSTVVYVSLPSTTSTCSNLGLPTLPSGYTYNCVTNQNLRNTDGTGWIPVNFQRISSNSPISQLPVDPINTTSTRLYYAYVSGGSWELNASIEASKNKLGGSNDLVSKDGGSAASQYEIGNNLTLSPIETGDNSLVGYWNFEEGPNATSTDRSGYGNNGTWYGTSTAQQHYTTGKVGNYSGYFNGSGDFINIIYQSIFNFTGQDFSVSAWVNPSVVGFDHYVVGQAETGLGDDAWAMRMSGGELRSTMNGLCDTGASTVSTNAWTFVSAVFNAQTKIWTLFWNGQTKTTTTCPGTITTSARNILIGSFPSHYPFFGLIDDVRIYNRALSTAEISALYNTTK